ncbi:MAG: histidinol-phosphatase HisJ family protein [Carnobacterium sp.]|uniref:histidinol-phosphatase HisJ family protein n=1 Tax=Carnobacterium sp. CS13 TaxID=2800128 RepID=UPI0019134084|nr:histidinol-phosphatase HisJ family protein [Carnobacterium sp. CS13]QQP70113.1 histidinol-phosphatase HisJ family protein [Carnobacterium sp. CS13]
MVYADYHVHSDYSDDSWYLMEDVVKDAIQLGLEEICFTDHVDYGVKPDWKPEEEFQAGKNKDVKNVHYELYFSELEKLSKKYEKNITIKKGLEFGMQIHTIPQFEKLYQSQDFDFILLSVHQIENKEFWTGEFQKGHTHRESYDRYYDEMYQLVTSYKEYSVLAHMDLVRRYLDKEVDMFEYSKDKIVKILKKVIEDNKGIEINTSSVRYGINGLTPSIEILKLYHELGGKIITIGSDSHKPEHLGFHIKESKKILKDIGYTHFCTFDKMKPIFHKL